jgi:hypothetical protein
MVVARHWRSIEVATLRHAGHAGQQRMIAAIGRRDLADGAGRGGR